MSKIVRLTESDLTRLVRRVVSESKENTIDIPKRFRHLRNEVGATATPNEIKKMWNQEVLPDTMGDTPRLTSFEDGKFVNAKGKSFPVSAILDEINYALSDEDEDEDDED